MTTTTEISQTPPVLKGRWPIGSVAGFIKDPLKFFGETVPKFEGIFEVTSPFFGHGGKVKRLYIISKPAYVKHILQDNNKNYVKSFGYQVLRLLLGNGLLTSEGDFWRKQRRLMQPAFHRERLANLVKVMTEETKALSEKWQAYPDEKVISLSEEMMGLTLHIVCKAMFSTDVDMATETVNREFGIANEKLIKRITNPLRVPIGVPTPGNIREKRAYKGIQGIVKTIIEKRRASKERYDDLLGMLMEVQDEDTGERMSDTQLMDEVVTIFLAGHETTAVALTWLFHCVEENPEVEERLLVEADRVLDGKMPQMENIRELTYTKMVVDETLRLYPPAWIIGRHAVDKDEIGGFTIPKDTNCLIPVYYIHRDPKIWGAEPEKFNPERFSAENSKGRSKFEYFPFGGGPRLCIGNNFALMEMQIVVPMLLKLFKLQKPKGFKFKKDPLITMRPEPEMQMVLSKR